MLLQRLLLLTGAAFGLQNQQGRSYLVLPLVPLPHDASHARSEATVCLRLPSRQFNLHQQLAGQLTPLRCAGRATFSFLVTGWPLFRPTAIPFATMLATWPSFLPEE